MLALLILVLWGKTSLAYEVTPAQNEIATSTKGIMIKHKINQLQDYVLQKREVMIDKMIKKKLLTNPLFEPQLELKNFKKTLDYYNGNGGVGNIRRRLNNILIRKDQTHYYADTTIFMEYGSDVLKHKIHKKLNRIMNRNSSALLREHDMKPCKSCPPGLKDVLPCFCYFSTTEEPTTAGEAPEQQMDERHDSEEDNNEPSDGEKVPSNNLDVTTTDESTATDKVVMNYDFYKYLESLSDSHMTLRTLGWFLDFYNKNRQLLPEIPKPFLPAWAPYTRPELTPSPTPSKSTTKTENNSGKEGTSDSSLEDSNEDSSVSEEKNNNNPNEIIPGI